MTAVWPASVEAPSIRCWDAWSVTGLVETYRAASNGGPQRKYYRPSSAGRLALALGVLEWRAARNAVDAVLAR